MNLPLAQSPFRLGREPIGSLPFQTRVASVLERVSGLRQLDALYQLAPRSLDADQFLHYVLELFEIRHQVPDEDLALVPRTGGTILFANHPFGAIEGVVLASLLRTVRPDVRVMANHFLKRVPEISDLFIAVDPFGSPHATRTNSRPLREAVRWVRSGGLLVIFPAGEVSHLQVQRRTVTDPAWHPSLARLARLTGATLVPTYIHGANGPWFQLAGLVHPRLRTLLLPRELLNKRDTTIAIRIGQPLRAEKTASYADDTALTDYLRRRTYALQALHSAAHLRQGNATREGVAFDAAPIASAVPASLLSAEVEALPADRCLGRSGQFTVHCARAEQIPWVLQEIGRLREITFRATGEGTGKPADVDLYDSYYLHLFVWNSEAKQVVGAYRLGLADEILPRFGKQGFYTHSLFKYRTRLLKTLGPAIELGRSFVRAEYQKSFSPLLLLWKGIARFAAANPQYRILFGPVSISNEYQTASRQVMVEFLRAHNYQSELARWVKPRKPFRPGTDGLRKTEWVGLDDLDDVSELLSRIESDGKGVPILLKQYLKLGGRLLGFNVDPQFNDALDGLIMVDLCETDPKVLERYMGKEETARFLAYHRSKMANPASPRRVVRG
jgi:putative hemolysin